MERPWGLSGPEFLELYWIALALSLVVAIVVRVRPRGSRGAREGAPAGALGLLDIAYLIGGPRRVVETSVARLIATGALVPARNGAVRLAGSAVADHPVDQAVLTDATRYRYRTLTLLITSVSEQDAPRAVGRRLSEMDYLLAPNEVRSRTWRAVAPMALLFGVGVARWVNGLAIGAPGGWLTLQLVLTAVLVVVLVKVNPLPRTALGRAAVAEARAGENTGGWGGTSSAREAELVALNGFGGHPDVTLRAAVRPRPRAASGGAYAAGGIIGTSSCSGGGGGSSCGGGAAAVGVVGVADPVAFLWWCGAALVVAVVVGLRLKRVTGASPRRVLTFEELGYLGGGPVRAVEVALAGLVAENRARVSGPVVTPVDAGP
ncbi:MAG: TIGR04222 domain-containing membrane protein, partial [Saccharothrix sp.]|nr:TIGR04222 domain-containing membrane protein [Saccharothrix sp.]